MKKPFRDTEGWKWLRTLLQLIGIALFLIAASAALRWLTSDALAESMPEERWVFCEDVLLVREGPGKKATATGELEPGTMVYTDRKTRNGYTHLVGLANESGDGWVRSVYLSREKTEKVGREATVISKGRLAARQYVGGKRKAWLKPGSRLKVYLRTAEWCVTDRGYVMTKYLKTDGE